MSSEDKASYRQIMKATSIFGGVQVFNIAIAIVRSKAIAVLLGPAGMGIVGLLTSTTGLIGALTNFGLGTSAVKDISEAHAENDENRMARTTAIFRKLVWITGGLGALLTAIFAPLLSRITFGNADYTWTFVFLSVTLLLSQLTAAQNVLLQGTRKLKYLAYANMLGSLSSLFIALPLYYFYGEDGIVPALIIMGYTAYLTSLFFSGKIKMKKVKVGLKESFNEGGVMLKLGFILSFFGVLELLNSFLLRIFINSNGGLEDVGLYSAGFHITNSYVGLVFSAMATDYFPRLSGVANNDIQRNNLVNQQGEIAILILFPIILIFIVFMPYIVQFLYSSKFHPIHDMIIWAAFAMFFKAGSWAIAFQFLAKGSSKLFFINELATNIYLLIFNIIGYYYFGLTGLGYSFLITYIIYCIQVYFLTNHYYKFSLESGFLKTFTIAVAISVLCILITLIASSLFRFFFGVLFILGGITFSIYQLNHKTGIIAKLKFRK